VLEPRALPLDPTAVDTLPAPFACDRGDSEVGTVWLHVSGEVDLAVVPRLVRILSDAQASGAALVALDLSEIGFLDTSGVHAIVDAAHACQRDGHRLQLVPAQELVQRIFELTGSSAAVTIIEGEEGTRPRRLHPTRLRSA
jgi:anti-sigma B factor antagonist